MDRVKTVLISGGSRGIGAEAVKTFASNGWKVVFLYNMSEKDAKNVTKNTGAFGIRCDVSKYDDVKDAIAKVKAELGINFFDAVVCNAGISRIQLFTETTVKDWDEIMATNLNGVFYTIKETLPEMISNKAGKIVIVSSMWGQVGASCEVAYSASKAALIGLTKSLAKEVAPSGINVNCVAPGVIDTDMNKELDLETRKGLIEEIPFNAFGKPSDVAEVIYFLTTEGSNYVSGQVIGVNGALIV
ncbi:MAG: SDR family oxidoreductase [Anaerovoracaceae bacterium]